MRVAICPGSFDPVTNGHLDIFRRASLMFDKVIVAVFFNPSKAGPLFSIEQRVDMLKLATKDIPNIEIDAFSGLLNEYAANNKVKIIIRGLRALTDFEYEFQRALLIKKIDDELETVFIMTSAEYSFLSSSGVRELLTFNGNIGAFVPKCVEDKIYDYLKQPNNN